jgi:L-asparaginase II
VWVETRRGAIPESRHVVHAAVVDGDGRLVAHAGEPELVTFWRSAAKPFQALPLLLDGAAERFDLTREQLALACASHSSEPQQVALVREFLRKIDCTEGDLMCGPHRPLSESVARDYETRGVRLTAAYSNCSGKHAGMLALAKHHGWPTEFYARLAHPVQQRCLAEVSRATDVPVDRVGVAVDGCGVACFALPLRNMALAYARLGMRDAGFEMRDDASRISHPASRQSSRLQTVPVARGAPAPPAVPPRARHRHPPAPHTRRPDPRPLSRRRSSNSCGARAPLCGSPAAPPRARPARDTPRSRSRRCCHLRRPRASLPRGDRPSPARGPR